MSDQRVSNKKHVMFSYTIHDIRDATEKEIKAGKPSMPSLH